MWHSLSPMSRGARFNFHSCGKGTRYDHCHGIDLLHLNYLRSEMSQPAPRTLMESDKCSISHLDGGWVLVKAPVTSRQITFA